MMIERIEVNLLPAEYRVHTRRFYLQREIIYPLIIIGSVFVVFTWWTLWLTQETHQYENLIAQKEMEIAQNKHILDEIKNLEEQEALLEKKIRALERITINREKWIRLQEIFCKKLPLGTWLDRMEEKGAILEIDGKTYSFSEVAQYMASLTETEYVAAIDLIRIEQIDAADRLFRFSIHCHINPDAGFTVN